MERETMSRDLDQFDFCGECVRSSFLRDVKNEDLTPASLPRLPHGQRLPGAGFYRLARGLARVHFRGGSLMKPFDSKRRSWLRQTISLSTPLGCLQSHTLQAS